MIAKDRHKLGDSTVIHKGKATLLPVGLAVFDSLVENIETAFEYQVGYIPAGVEHRPDLISNIFYNTPSYWWVIMLVNGINDPFEQLNVGDRILIPNI